MDTPSITSHFAEVIQTSLAPVFLLAGTAGFVNIYVGRLAKLSDRLNDIVEKTEKNKSIQVQLAYLRGRVFALEIAAFFGVSAGICTCAAILNLLAGTLAIGIRQENLFWFFSGAVIFLMFSLAAFLFELAVAGRNMIRQIRSAKRPSDAG
ncbi:DUF2721 domain-containing protein [Brucella cytisi]|uniref:DUF2721 domain-containing protein n=1 Tax=Brucella cytisi TaxID=407152 RepID=A0A1J6HCS0_9HYPH|nr:DUF2721 domain-containing protein [Brucella cytisi]OIS90385.1 hypothetical protein BLA27_27080 [Brucella cytisi]